MIGCIVANRTVSVTTKPAVVPVAETPHVAPAPWADVPAVAKEELAGQFDGKFKKFVQSYCIDCHSGPDPVGDLDLDVQDMQAMVGRSNKLQKMVAKLSRSQMPPASAEKSPALRNVRRPSRG